MSRIGIRSAHYTRELAEQPRICCVCQQPITAITVKPGPPLRYCSATCRVQLEKQRARQRNRRQAAPPVDTLDEFFREQQARVRQTLHNATRRIRHARARQYSAGSDSWIGDEFELLSSTELARRKAMYAEHHPPTSK